MFKKIITFSKKHYLDYFFVFLISFLVFFYIQSPASLPDPDSFYHAKVAEIIKKDGIIKDFPWTQFSTLKDNYIDHHFLYHLYLVPFTLIFEPLIAIKVATIFLDVLLIMFFYFFLAHFKIRGRFLWILVLLSVNPFLFRISLAKAPALSIIFLLLGFYALVNYRRLLLFLVSFFYVWAYSGWPLIWLLAIIYFIVDMIYDRFNKKSMFWQTIKLIIGPIAPHKKKKKRLTMFFTLIIGTVAGLVINPYFPKNIYFYYQQIYQIAIVNLQKIIGVGGEWYPYGPINLINDIGILTPVLIIAIIIFLLSFKKQSRISIILFFITLFFFLYTLKARRSVEYFVPFSLLFASFSLNDFIRSYFKSKKLLLKLFPWFKKVIVSLLVIIFILFIFIGRQSIIAVRSDIQNGINIKYLQDSGIWLRTNTQSGAIVLHSDWDEFPMLFYYSDNNYYINGLDQTFMYNYDKEIYWKWVNITLGKEIDNLTSIIKNDFQAEYILVETDHKAMDNLFRNNQDFKRVYQDNEARIYKVK